MAKFLDATGLTYLWGKITAAFQPKITASGLLKGDGSGGVTAATSGTDYQAAINATGLLKGSGSGSVSAATAGTDYQAPLTNPVTGTGTSGYLAKFNGGTTVTNGPAIGSGTTTFLRNDGTWQTPAYPVTSVNSKTGAVSLSASDVGALPSSTTIPAYTSQLINNSGYITGYTETDPKVNRTTAVNVSDGNYTTYMARGEALNSADSNPSANGCISWTYA